MKVPDFGIKHREMFSPISLHYCLMENVNKSIPESGPFSPLRSLICNLMVVWLSNKQLQIGNFRFLYFMYSVLRFEHILHANRLCIYKNMF